MTKQTSLLLLVFSCLLSNISAQPNYTVLLHKPYEQRCYLLDSLFYTEERYHPADTGRMIQQTRVALQQVAALARKEGDKELQLEAAYYHLRFCNEPHPESVTDEQVRQLLQQVQAGNYQQLKTKVIALQAMRQWRLYHNVWASIELYLNACRLLKEIPIARFPDKQNHVYRELGAIYYDLEDYENAKAILLEGALLPYYPVPFWPQKSNRYHLLNTLGLSYRASSQYDSALLYLKEAHTIAILQKDSLWIGITDGNMGITYFLQKRYAEAVPLLEKDVQLSMQYSEFGNAANSLLKLARISLEQHNRPVAYQQAATARQALTDEIKRYKHFNQYYNLNTRFNDYYQLMAALYATDGNALLAYRYADSALRIQDTIFQQKKEVIIKRAQQKTDNEHLKLEVEKLEHRQRTQTLIRNGLLCVLGLLVIITLLLVSRQRLLKKQRQFAEARRLHTRKELEDARKQLQHFTHNIREKNELIERLNTEMVDLQTSLSKETIDYRQTTLEQLRRQTILTDEEWETFRASFEKVYSGWFEGIGKKLPGLSAADLRFMALSKLKLNTREMAAVLGISPGSVRMSRHRIRKKYNLDDEESLELLAGEV